MLRSHPSCASGHLGMSNTSDIQCLKTEIKPLLLRSNIFSPAQELLEPILESGFLPPPDSDCSLFEPPLFAFGRTECATEYSLTLGRFVFVSSYFPYWYRFPHMFILYCILMAPNLVA